MLGVSRNAPVDLHTRPLGVKILTVIKANYQKSSQLQP